MGTIKKLAIFCGSKAGANDLYTDHARQLATLLAQKNVELIYGGGRNGLMGTVADTVMAAGGIVRGVIPQVLKSWEAQHDSLSELLVVDDMHVRKRKLYELCDAAVVLTGGFGTLDELFEILTWNQLSIHDKRVFILNSGGFYTHLINHIKHCGEEQFLYGKFEDVLTVINDPQEMAAWL